MATYVIENQIKTNIDLNCDVLVAGGGIAGVAAAIAAARNGASVTLLEREYSLGGLATLGLITIYLPLCDGMGNQISFGIAEELLRLSIKHGAEKNYPVAWLNRGTKEQRVSKRFMTQFNPILYAIEMEKLLLDLDVRILYGTLAVDVVKLDDRIEAVILENKSGRSAIQSKTVIDCTGDSDICKFADEKTELYKPKNSVASWYYYFEKDSVQLKMFGLADIVPDQEGQQTFNETVQIIGSKRYTGVDGVELSDMVINAHQEMFDDIMKHKDKNPKYVPVSISTIPLVRMTRKIVGTYILHDTESHKQFEDSIGMISDWRKCGPVYEVPFRCLMGDNVCNLLVAGRNISVTDEMWDITRVIPACAVTGEAAGTAAALFEDFRKVDLKKLQVQLKSQNAVLHQEGD
ncbi:FAD-dependent oxidoreductase [Alkalibaculum sp. M08DMB]|uniref:FAD-dependent oxidoreductase n=1 Tax=Alkalibaculum sporogenes TaxID=2655001 RepID=A0A6A7K832_9FIRM|nr:FAD-dependent oxidoreductase [Alkalibaculum sporogenes]MPW25649.1 FAD-dependent oxidoreductase [Alkalibaculum sporogenes]